MAIASLNNASVHITQVFIEGNLQWEEAFTLINEVHQLPIGIC